MAVAAQMTGATRRLSDLQRRCSIASRAEIERIGARRVAPTFPGVAGLLAPDW